MAFENYPVALEGLESKQGGEFRVSVVNTNTDFQFRPVFVKKPLILIGIGCKHAAGWQPLTCKFVMPTEHDSGHAIRVLTRQKHLATPIHSKTHEACCTENAKRVNTVVCCIY